MRMIAPEKNQAQEEVNESLTRLAPSSCLTWQNNGISKSLFGWFSFYQNNRQNIPKAVHLMFPVLCTAKSI